jgi:hypothetical protein
MSDLREKFRELARRVPVFERVVMPDIGEVFVKELTAGEKDAWEKALPDNKMARAETIVYGCFDEQGVRIFEDEDIEMVRLMSPTTLKPILEAFIRVNHLGTVDEAEAKNLNGQAASS